MVQSEMDYICEKVLFLTKIYFYFLCMVFACIYACAPHVCSVHRGQKKALDSLELESLLIVSHGSWELNLCKSSKCFNCCAISLGLPKVLFLFFCFETRVSLGSQGWTQTHNPISTSQVLGFYKYAILPGKKKVLLFFFKFYKGYGMELFRKVLFYHSSKAGNPNNSHLNLD